MFFARSISHHTTPLHVREPLSLTDDQQVQWLERTREPEAVVLSTCNRLELYTFAPSARHADQLWADLLAQSGSRADDAAPYTAVANGTDAPRHLFRVSCGLESMALGEPQILGQVTRAYEQSHSIGAAGAALSLLFRSAIHAAKRARTETAISGGGASVSSLGIHRAEEALGSLVGRSIVVIGAGEMGQSIVKALVQRGLTQITVVSRTYDTARRLAVHWDVRVRPITELGDAMQEADVVFTTSNAPFTILAAADIASVMAQRAGRTLCLVDLAVPRDVEQDAGDIPGVLLYDLDDLQQVIEQTLAERRSMVPHVERIIDEELVAFWHDHRARTVAPTIRQLRERAEALRQVELERLYNRLPDDERSRDLIDQFSERFMNKLLHQLTHNLKVKATGDEGPMLAAIARDLFGLEDTA
ncbi:glutamyl-tRNA reductase [Aggregatilinea lenta]|uniref:glutamyl-tRNA reductase n=1 Tax=Aggregatilinea lenta TaxID=913108 RepID=UPI000E5A12A9|nr:glutamyl-tRNA reductase [Aggregatilinea lenta]